LALTVLYPASIFPVIIACRWLIWFEVFDENGQIFNALNTAYAPVVWAVERSPGINEVAGRALAKASPPNSVPSTSSLE
jgi:hypothetical protein